MGCGASNSKGGDSNPNEIKSEMKWTKIHDLDEYFKTASEFLENLEDLRSTFEDTRDEMNEIGRTSELATPSLVEALRVFFWSVSAHKEGAILAAGIRYTTDPVAFTVDCSYMDWITYNFSQALMDLIGGMIEAPGKIIEAGQLAKEIGEKSAELSKELADKVKSSGLNPLDQAKASANAAVNFKTIASGVAKVPHIVKMVEETIKDIKEVLPKITELLGTADEVGKKAHEKGMRKIDELFDHFQTAPKKTPEQIKAEKKGKKPKKGKRKSKKGAEHGKAGEHGKAAEHGKAEEHGKAAEHGKAGEHGKPEEHGKPAEHGQVHA